MSWYQGERQDLFIYGCRSSVCLSYCLVARLSLQMRTRSQLVHLDLIKVKSQGVPKTSYNTVDKMPQWSGCSGCRKCCIRAGDSEERQINDVLNEVMEDTVEKLMRLVMKRRTVKPCDTHCFLWREICLIFVTSQLGCHQFSLWSFQSAKDVSRS